MTSAVCKQYELEIKWSTRITDEIVLESIQGGIPLKMELNLLQKIIQMI